jgi:predicted transcriptional regulator
MNMEDNMDKIKMEVPYFQSPNAIFEVEGLTTYELATYLYLCRCGNQGSKIFPSYADIAHKINASERTAQRAIQGLFTKELIIKQNTYKKTVNGKFKQSSNIYEIYTDIEKYLETHKAKGKIINNLDNKEIIPLSHCDTTLVSESHGGIVTQSPHGCHSDQLTRTIQKEQNKKNYTTTENENVVVVKNLIETFKNKYHGDLDPKLLNNLIKEKGIDVIEKCIQVFGEYVSSANEVEKVFYKFCKTWGTGEQFKKNTGYKNYNNKPAQATNYEQRQYDDEFFDNLYDNVKYVKEE